MEPFLGQIILFGGNFAPRGWALCDGQLLPISSYSALFSLLGTTYGGDGRTTFALPDLRGRAPIHFGHGAGLSSYALGARGGQEYTTLNALHLPSHSHDAASPVAAGSAMTDNPVGLAPAETSEDSYAAADANGPSLMMTNTGGNQSFDQRKPYTAINYIIALQGTYPSRS